MPKKVRMTPSQAIRYWTKRHDSEKRQLAAMERRKATLEKQIEKQRGVIEWALAWLMEAEYRRDVEIGDDPSADAGD